MYERQEMAMFVPTIQYLHNKKSLISTRETFRFSDEKPLSILILSSQQCAANIQRVIK